MHIRSKLKKISPSEALVRALSHMISQVIKRSNIFRSSRLVYRYRFCFSVHNRSQTEVTFLFFSVCSKVHTGPILNKYPAKREITFFINFFIEITKQQNTKTKKQKKQKKQFERFLPSGSPTQWRVNVELLQEEKC